MSDCFWEAGIALGRLKWGACRPSA